MCSPPTARKRLGSSAAAWVPQSRTSSRIRCQTLPRPILQGPPRPSSSKALQSPHPPRHRTHPDPHPPRPSSSKALTLQGPHPITLPTHPGSFTLAPVPQNMMQSADTGSTLVTATAPPISAAAAVGYPTSLCDGGSTATQGSGGPSPSGDFILRPRGSRGFRFRQRGLRSGRGL